MQRFTSGVPQSHSSSPSLMPLPHRALIACRKRKQQVMHPPRATSKTTLTPLKHIIQGVGPENILPVLVHYKGICRSSSSTYSTCSLKIQELGFCINEDESTVKVVPNNTSFPQKTITFVGRECFWCAKTCASFAYLELISRVHLRINLRTQGINVFIYHYVINNN